MVGFLSGGRTIGTVSEGFEITSDYKLLLTFADGKQGAFDCKPYRKYEFMAEVWDEEVFSKVVVDHGTVMWPGGEDLCPDDLYDDSVKV